jgi:hypothetical protein
MGNSSAEQAISLTTLQHTRRYRLAAWLSEHIGRVRLKSADQLWRKACKKAGPFAKNRPLDQAIEKPLEAIIEALAKEAQLNAVGRQAATNILLWQLVTRLQVEHALEKTPAILSKPLPRPLIITGMPRTGTTLLHRMLAQDPDIRSLQLWEMALPTPPPTVETYSADKRRKAVAKSIAFMRWWMSKAEKRHFQQVHDSDWFQPEECIFLLARSFYSEHFFFLLGSIPSYTDWVVEQDNHEAYAFYAKQLQLLCNNFNSSGLVLKAPAHLSHLAALFKALPDARVVWLHRNPEEVVPSCCSLAGMYHRQFSDQWTSAGIGNEVLRQLSGSVKLGMQYCQETSDQRIYHLSYQKLVKDPFGTVKELYSFWDQSNDSKGQEAMQKWYSAHPKDKFGKHKYSLEDFSLDKKIVEQAFVEYNSWYPQVLD